MWPAKRVTMHALSIQNAHATDAEAVARIYVDSWNQGFSYLIGSCKLFDGSCVSRWGAALTLGPPHLWWTAKCAGAIVGFAGIGPSRDPVDPELGEVNTIAVAPNSWRTGVGRALMSRALSCLLADGYREAVLWTMAGYPRGERFYEAMGWNLDGVSRDEGRQVCYRHRLRGTVAGWPGDTGDSASRSHPFRGGSKTPWNQWLTPT